jgi:predicted Zn-dependent protease
MSANDPRSFWVRLLLSPWSLLKVMFRWFRGAPRWMQIVLALLIVSLTGFGIYYGVKRTMKRQQQQSVKLQWEEFEKAAKTNQIPEMKKTLETLSQIEPGNTLATQRLQALEKLDADPSDEAMVFLTLRIALEQQKWPEAAREARKRLETNPKDWLSRCVVALEKLQRGDGAGASQQLDLLPDPTDSYARVQPGGLLLSYRLFRALNRDTTTLRRFIETNVAQVIRNPNLESLAAGEKLILVECLLEGIDPKQERLNVSLVQCWAPTNNLLASASEQVLSTGDLRGMVSAARQTPKLDLYLKMLIRDQVIGLEQAEQAQREFETRTQKLWQEVQQRSPKLSEAYRGQALSFLRQNNYASAREAVTRGMAEVGADPELLTLFSRMLQLEGQSNMAYSNLVEAARKNPEQALNWWGLAAEAAITGNRRDLALEACQKMRQLAPKHFWANRTEALLWIDADQPKKALELLESLGQEAILQQPLVLRAYTRALVLANREKDATQILVEAEKLARTQNKAITAVSVLIGWFEATTQLVKVDFAKMIAEKSDRLLEIWPEDTGLMRLRADSRMFIAEHTTPAWEPGKVSEALQAVERIRAVVPEELAYSLALAQLHLFGQNNAPQAARDLSAFFTGDRWKQSPANELTLIGQILQKNQQLDQSLMVLELASRSREAKAKTFIQLAMTLQLLGRNAEARRALQVAQPMPRTNLEQLEYIAAAKLIVP